MYQDYYNIIKYLETLSTINKKGYMLSHQRGGNFFLERTQELVNQAKINLEQFKFIHLAGTAGKGTTTTMVHNILQQADYKVGSYYSPHPTTTIERIKVNNKFISPNNFVRLVKELKPVIGKMAMTSKYGQPSYFEILLTVALKYFAQQKCEYVILETGCGGEFDATNIITKPLITAITNVGFDHTHLLGKTLIKIATTKAGIIKPKSKFITTEKHPHILKIFNKICQQKNAEFISIKPNKSDILNNNVLLATKIIEELKIFKNKINSCFYQKDISKGITKTKLSCRWEIMQTKPTVILDGAHNLDKLKTVSNNLKHVNFDKLYLIFTLNVNKDIKKIINYFARMLAVNFQNKQIEIILTKHLVTERKCADLKMMKKLFQTTFKQFLKIKIIINPHKALKQTIKKAADYDVLLITGSFYLAGELRKKWISEENILKENS